MLEPLLHPRGIVVIGASHNPSKLGYGVARNLMVSGYRGALHFVNPKGGTLFDQPVYRSVADVPDPLDLAVVLIPAPSIPEVLEACGRRGLRAAIIGSGGFREVGPEGMELERRCLEIVRRYKMRALGPNCIGYLDTHLPIDTTFLPLPGPIPGDIAFLSHSGAICEAVIDWARGQGFGLSRLISLGNQMDLTEADLLPPTAEDPHTKVIAMYLEGVGDGRKFVEQARLVTRRKPVVAIKVGRSESGRQAVASHTGAMAGRDAAYQAAFRHAGVMRAESSEEMFDWARALAWCPLPAGRRVAVLTNAGGPGAIAVDALETQELLIAELSGETRSQLAALLPPAASVRNPVDMLASASPAEFANCLRLLLDDPGVDSVMVIIPPPPMTTAGEVVGAMVPLVRSSSKPVLVVLMGEELIAHAARILRLAHVPDYRFPERAASALRALAERAEYLQRPEEQAWAPSGISLKAARKTLQHAQPGSDGFLDAHSAALVVQAYGIPSPAAVLTRSPEEAAEAGRQLGFPVALKVCSPDLPHKSDIGGVALGLDSPNAVAEGYRQMTARMQAAAPQARVLGILVQPMIAPGQEVILGMVRDAQFGPLVMFGSGGVEVEGLRDVAFALAPLTPREAEWLLDSTWAGRRLRGYRNLPPADRQAVLEALLRLGQLAVDLPPVAELEINPLRVLSAPGGALALDVRLRVAGGS